MRIALVSPRSSFLGRNAEFRKFFKKSPEMEFYRQYWSGLGLGLLVIGALTPENIEIELIDENVEDMDFTRKYDLVGITAMTQQATRAYEIAGEFRKRNIKVVLGGIHPTVMPDEAGKYADSVVIGEAEDLWQGLIEDFRHGRLKPFYSSGKEVDINKSPVPNYGLLKGKPYRILWVQSSRGCPHDCSFCCASRVYGLSYRHKSVEQVIEAVKRIRRMNSHAIVGFSDDNLFCNRNYSRQLLEKLVDLKVKWIGQSDISIAGDDELLRFIRASGCIALFIGFESIDEKNLKGLDSSDWKMKHFKNYVKGIKAIQNNGIGIIGTFMVGFDNDTKSVFDRVAGFIIDNHLAGAQIAALTPFPNTRIREKLIGEGRVLDTPWENYTLYDVNIKPKKMTSHELESGILDTFKKVYSHDVAVEKTRYFKDVFSRVGRGT